MEIEMIIATLLIAGLVFWLALRATKPTESERVAIPVRVREKRPNRRI